METKKDHIIKTASQLFATQGFENTSVAQLCKEAQVSKGLVYHYFKTKDDILRELFSKATKNMIAMSLSSEQPVDQYQRLQSIINQIFSQLKNDKVLFQFNLNIMLQPSTKAILSDLIKIRSEHLLTSVKQIFKAIDTVDYEAKSFLFIAELDGIALDYLSIFETYPLDQVKEQLLKKYQNNDQTI